MPPSTIVVGVDFSPESRLAVDHAIEVARRTGMRLVLIHVGAIPEKPEAVPSSLRTAAERWFGVVQTGFDEDRVRLAALRHRLSGQGVEVSHVVKEDFPDAALVAAAHELDAALLVVGTHGRTGIKRFFLGSVAELTVRTADTSVLVARGDAPAGGYHRIVVGTDFSAQAQRAFERALQLAAPDATVRVVHAWTLPGLSTELPRNLGADLQTGIEAAAAELHDQLAPLARSAAVHLQVDTVHGPAAAVMDDLSTSADLVVVGSHGRRGLRRFLLGSVAEATVRHARCSVLVVR